MAEEELARDVGDAPDLDARSATAHGERPRIGMYYPRAGHKEASGVVTYVREISRHLARGGPTVVYTQVSSESPLDAAVETVPLGESAGWDRLQSLGRMSPVTLTDLSPELSESVAAFVSVARNGVLDHIERNVDVVFTQDLFDTALLSRATDVPIVRLFHCCPQAGPGWHVFGRLADTAGVLANSEQTARGLTERLGVDVDGVVYPGIDLDAFVPDREPAFRTTAPTILFVGRFVPAKGIYDLLEAFAGLSSDAHLRIVGRGDVDRLRRVASEQGVMDAVTIETEVPYDRMPRYYAAADVACLPTHDESFGLVNLEAMACECPVVTADLPGVREYATDGENALLVPPRDPDRLRAALDRLLGSPELRSRLGAAGRRTAEQYSWAAAADRLAALAADIVERSD